MYLLVSTLSSIGSFDTLKLKLVSNTINFYDSFIVGNKFNTYIQAVPKLFKCVNVPNYMNVFC